MSHLLTAVCNTQSNNSASQPLPSFCQFSFFNFQNILGQQFAFGSSEKFVQMTQIFQPNSDDRCQLLLLFNLKIK
jgi:hypothetical protein